MGFEVTPSGITIRDPVTGQVRVKMGVLGDEPVARARLYVLGQPQVMVEVTSTENWEEVRKLKDAWGTGATVYMWVEGQGPDTRWRSASGDYGWRYAKPPDEIALANYLLEGE